MDAGLAGLSVKCALVLVVLLLASCAADRSCAWGGRTETDAERCAEDNFGSDGAAYLNEQATVCRACYDAVTPEIQQYCAVNCKGD